MNWLNPADQSLLEIWHGPAVQSLRDAVKAATSLLKELKFANDEVALAATLVGLRLRGARAA